MVIDINWEKLHWKTLRKRKRTIISKIKHSHIIQHVFLFAKQNFYMAFRFHWPCKLHSTGKRTGWCSFLDFLTKYLTISFRVKGKDSMWIKKIAQKPKCRNAQEIFSIQLIQNLAPCISSEKDTGWEFQRSLRELQLLIHLKFEFQIRDGHLDPSDLL